MIFARALSGRNWRICTTPRGVGGGQYNGVGPTQQAVDAFAMANGKYPITGYTDNGATPIIDAESEYSETGFTTFTHPFDGSTARATYNMYVNREPRFYVSVLWSGCSWKYGTGSLDDVQFHMNGNSGPASGEHNYPKPGYLIAKMADHSLNHANNEYGRFSWAYLRLGEIFLNYAEALNEYDPGNADILRYINLIRERAGVPNLEEVYPEDVADQESMREMLRRERQVELASEGIRFWDSRTWRISEDTEN